MAYQAGDLDQLVTIKREVRTADAMGGASVTLQDVASVWALVRPMTGRERLAANTVEASSNYRVVVRTGTDVTEADQIHWGGVVLNVRFVKPYPRSPWLEIEAEAGVAA